MLTTQPVELRPMQEPALIALEAGFQWTVGREVAEQLAFSGDTGRFEVAGLPPGVRVNATTGLLSGRPTRAGAYSLRVKITNAVGNSGLRTIPAQVAELLVAGQYVGLLDRGADLFHGRGGKLVLAVNSLGSASGALTVHNTATKVATYRLMGALKNISGPGTSALFEVSLGRGPGLPPLELACQITGAELSIKLAGEPAGAGGRTAGQSSLAGLATLALQAPGAPVPLGAIGYARLALSARGAMIWSGKLACAGGVRPVILATSLVARNGAEAWPVYAALSGTESFTGWIVPEGAESRLLGEACAWSAPPVAQVWSGGDVSFTVRGGLWTAPQSPQIVMNLEDKAVNARLRLGTDHFQDIRISPAHRVQIVGESSWTSAASGSVLNTMTINAATGNFSGLTMGGWSGVRILTPRVAPLPWGQIDGVFVPSLDRGIGIFTPRDRQHTPGLLALPVILEPLPLR